MRTAAGISIEELAMQDAFMEGQRAGSLGTPAGQNPWEKPELPEYQSWERGRRAGEAYRLWRKVGQRLS